MPHRASDSPTAFRGRPRDEGDDTLVTKLADFESPPVDDEERYSPQPPHQRRFRRPLIGCCPASRRAVAGLGMAYGWTRTQYFVGADQDKVAIFQGLSEGLPGLSLSRVYEIQQLTVSELPPFYQEQVKANIDVASLDSARETVAELTEAAKRCASPQPTASPHPRARQALPSKNPAASQPRHPRRPSLGGGAELLIMRVVAPVTVVPRKRRGVELALIIFALGLTLGAYALVDINVTGELSSAFPWRASASCSLHSPTLQSGGGSVRGPGDPAVRDLAQRPRPGDPPH